MHAMDSYKFVNFKAASVSELVIVGSGVLSGS